MRADTASYTRKSNDNKYQWSIISCHLSGVAFFSWRLADGDLPQESIVCIQHWGETQRPYECYGSWTYTQQTHMRRHEEDSSYLSARWQSLARCPGGQNEWSPLQSERKGPSYQCPVSITTQTTLMLRAHFIWLNILWGCKKVWPPPWSVASEVMEVSPRLEETTLYAKPLFILKGHWGSLHFQCCRAQKQNIYKTIYTFDKEDHLKQLQLDTQ